MKKIIISKGEKYGIFWPFKMPVRKTKLLYTTRPYSRLNEEVHILRRPNTSKNIRGLMWKKGFSEFPERTHTPLLSEHRVKYIVFPKEWTSQRPPAGYESSTSTSFSRSLWSPLLHIYWELSRNSASSLIFSANWVCALSHNCGPLGRRSARPTDYSQNFVSSSSSQSVCRVWCCAAVFNHNII